MATKRHLETKRHSNNNNINQRDDVDDEKNWNRPLQHGCYDNWTWSKRHRSQEVVFTDPTLRKGTLKRNTILNA